MTPPAELEGYGCPRESSRPRGVGDTPRGEARPDAAARGRWLGRMSAGAGVRGWDDRDLPPNTSVAHPWGGGARGSSITRSRPLTYADVILATVDLSNDLRVRVDCERCGRRLGFYALEDADRLYIHEVIREAVPLGPVNNPVRVDRHSGITRGKLTGRHRLRIVDDRGNDMRETGKIAYAFECGCGHRRTIGQDALRQKLLRAPEPENLALASPNNRNAVVLERVNPPPPRTDVDPLHYGIHERATAVVVHALPPPPQRDLRPRCVRQDRRRLGEEPVEIAFGARAFDLVRL